MWFTMKDFNFSLEINLILFIFTYILPFVLLIFVQRKKKIATLVFELILLLFFIALVEYFFQSFGVVLLSSIMLFIVTAWIYSINLKQEEISNDRPYNQLKKNQIIEKQNVQSRYLIK